MEAWLEPTLRFLQYSLLLGLFGWAAFRVIGLRAAGWLPAKSGAIANIAATLAPAVSAGLMLLSIAAMMGQPLAALEWSMIEAMALGTGMGWAFLVRTAFLIAAVAALLAAHASWRLPIAAGCFAGSNGFKACAGGATTDDWRRRSTFLWNSDFAAAAWTALCFGGAGCGDGGTGR